MLILCFAQVSDKARPRVPAFLRHAQGVEIVARAVSYYAPLSRWECVHCS